MSYTNLEKFIKDYKQTNNLTFEKITIQEKYDKLKFIRDKAKKELTRSEYENFVIKSLENINENSKK